MISVNTNFFKKISEPKFYLRIMLAVIFLSAGTYRVFSPLAAKSEFVSLGLPGFLSPIMVLFEIGAGCLLLFNVWAKRVYVLLAVFMVIVLAWALFLDAGRLFSAAGELFVFNLNPTDFFLHFVFLIIALTALKINKHA